MQKRAMEHPKIEILWNQTVIEAKGGAGGLTSIVLESTKDKSKKDLEVGGLFYAIGHVPNTQVFQGQLDLDETGYIVTKPGTTQTNVAGVFAAGDVQDKV